MAVAPRERLDDPRPLHVFGFWLLTLVYAVLVAGFLLGVVSERFLAACIGLFVIALRRRMAEWVTRPAQARLPEEWRPFFEVAYLLAGFGFIAYAAFGAGFTG